jgi:hypothetical protein
MSLQDRVTQKSHHAQEYWQISPAIANARLKPGQTKVSKETVERCWKDQVPQILADMHHPKIPQKGPRLQNERTISRDFLHYLHSIELQKS